MQARFFNSFFRAPRVPKRGALSLLVGGAVALALVHASCAGPERRPAQTPRPGQAALVLMTYNLNYGLAGDEAALEAIAGTDADLVLLQETTPAWEASLRGRFKDRYPFAIFEHCCLAGGLGVLSKTKVEEVDYIEPSKGGWFPGLRLSVQTRLGDLDVLNVHLRPQIGDTGANVGGLLSGQVSTPPIRRRQMDHLLAKFGTSAPAVVAGDFNESEGGSAVALLESKGFQSALPAFSDEDTWHWNTSFGRVARRFDHIAYGPGLDALSAKVVHAARSDHEPVVAVLVKR
jgi:endonuclease/exonuclease/phosphatase (EEP) superfamily protein YafD